MRADGIKQRIVDLLKAAPMTGDEVALALGMPALDIRPRLSELVNAGIIIDSGNRKPLASGKAGVMWMA